MTTNDEAAATFEESDLISLGQKLASLDLTEPERAALDVLISDDDVAGFARYDIGGSIRMGIRNFGTGGLRDNRGVRADGLLGSWEDEKTDLKKPGRF